MEAAGGAGGGAVGGAAGAEVVAGGGRRADGGGDAGPPRGGVGLAPAQRGLRFAPGAGHAVRSGRMSGSARRIRGMPRATVRWRRTMVTAWVICSRSAAV